MAKVNAEKHVEHIKTRFVQRLNFLMRNKEDQLSDLKSTFKKDFSVQERQDYALTLLVLESTISAIKLVIGEVNEIKLW